MENQNKTLKTIHTIEKVGKIVSMVIFVASIIGACSSIAAIIAMAIGNNAINLGDISIRGIIETEANMTVNEMYLALALGTITLIASAVMAWFVNRYLKQQLAAGTPVTMVGSKKSCRLGLILIITSLVASSIAGITALIMTSALHIEQKATNSFDTSFTWGIMFLILSVIYKYFAENTTPRVAKSEDQKEKDEEK